MHYRKFQHWLTDHKNLLKILIQSKNSQMAHEKHEKQSKGTHRTNGKIIIILSTLRTTTSKLFLQYHC